MTEQPEKIPFNKVRRGDRAIQDENWIEDYLSKAPFGILATCIDGQPFQNPNLFVYNSQTRVIFFHTSSSGHTLSNIRYNDRVCFTVCEMGRLLPAETAAEFSVEYKSVIVQGHVEILETEDERIYGLQLLMDKYFPHLRPVQDYPVLDKKGMNGAAVYKLKIQSWSAKQKKVQDDFAGAFYYSQQQASVMRQ